MWMLYWLVVSSWWIIDQRDTNSVQPMAGGRSEASKVAWRPILSKMAKAKDAPKGMPHANAVSDIENEKKKVFINRIELWYDVSALIIFWNFQFFKFQSYTNVEYEKNSYDMTIDFIYCKSTENFDDNAWFRDHVHVPILKIAMLIATINGVPLVRRLLVSYDSPDQEGGSRSRKLSIFFFSFLNNDVLRSVQ